MCAWVKEQHMPKIVDLPKKERPMAKSTDPQGRARFLRPAAIIVVVVALLVLVIWQFGPVPYSNTTPDMEGVLENPTGAGSNPDGAASVLEQNFPVEREDGQMLDGSTDATDLTGIEGSGEDDTVADEDRRLLEPGQVVSPEDGTVSNQTGVVQAPEEE